MRSFLKQTLASLLGTLAALSLLTLLGTGTLIIFLIAAVAGDTRPKVTEKSILVFDLSLNINDIEPLTSVTESLAGDNPDTITLREVLDAIAKATKDPNIVGLFLDGSKGQSETGYANLKEVRLALENFRQSGKKIIAYDVDLSEQKYYLLSAANTITINPLGIIDINGLSSEQAFFSGALEKFGIGIQVVRVGKYKSAVEPLIQDKLSPENREQLNNLLGDLWGDFLTNATKFRQIKQPQLQQLVNTKGFLLAEEGKEAGLIDRVGHFDTVVKDLKDLGTEDKDKNSFRQVEITDYVDVAVKEFKERESKNKIAVIYANGEIVPGEGGVDEIGSDRFVERFQKMAKDKDIKAVVLRIDSPGGSATASEIILREIQILKEKKPVIISMGNVAASGGYWVATGGDYIFAEPNTITGSIGVFGILPNVGTISKNNGITWDVVKTGTFADNDTIARPKTTQELAILQRFVDRIYNLFLEKVSLARKLPREKVAEIAQGRVWSGQDAQKLGLVDRLGGLEAAINYAAEKANLGNNWQIEEFQEKPSLEEILDRTLKIAIKTQQTQAEDPLSTELKRWHKDLQQLRHLSDPKGVYTHLPFSLHIK